MLRSGTLLIRRVHQVHAVRGQRTEVVVSKTYSERLELYVHKYRRQPRRMPLAKNFFVGTIDRELAAYPEVIERQALVELHSNVAPFKNYFEQVNESHVGASGVPPAEVIRHMRDMGAYGFNVSADHDGRDYGYTESLIASTPETEYPSVACALLPHRVVVDVLNEFGTADQQHRYGSRLCNGELVGTNAVAESCNDNTLPLPTVDALYRTRAEHVQLSTNEGYWLLNGEKNYVVTGLLPADSKPLFLVFAQTESANCKDKLGVSCLFVEADEPGVSCSEELLGFRCRGTERRKVSFTNVKVRDENVLGTPNNAKRYAEYLACSTRLRSTLIGFTLAKNMMNTMIAHCVHTKDNGEYLRNMQLMKCYLSKAHCAVYAIESMIFFTAGLLDGYKGQDVSMEVAITKYYTLRQLESLSIFAQNIIGAKCLHTDQITALDFHNVGHLVTQGESLQELAQYIAIIGMRYASVHMQDAKRLQRKTLLNPAYLLRVLTGRYSVENISPMPQLYENLHPTLDMESKMIEHSVDRLQVCVDMLLCRGGSEVTRRQQDLQRLTEIASSIYATWASISRGSRSYCIGLPYAEDELITATTMCRCTFEDVKRLSTAVTRGDHKNSDRYLTQLSKDILKQDNFNMPSPLAHDD